MASLSDRTADALLAFAALERDQGGAGYSEGMAENFRLGRGPGARDVLTYTERIERLVEQLLPEVETVAVAGPRLRVTHADGFVGCWVNCGAEVHRIAAFLAGTKED